MKDRSQAIVCSELAVGIGAGGRSRGAIAWRAELLIAKAADCTATRAYRRPTDPTCNQACSAIETIHSPVDAHGATVRRS